MRRFTLQLGIVLVLLLGACGVEDAADEREQVDNASHDVKAGDSADVSIRDGQDSPVESPDDPMGDNDKGGVLLSSSGTDTGEEGEPPPHPWRDSDGDGSENADEP